MPAPSPPPVEAAPAAPSVPTPAPVPPAPAVSPVPAPSPAPPPPPTAAEANGSATAGVAASPVSSLDTVIVTGLRGGPPRTVANSPAPIDVINNEQLLNTGRKELGEALASLLPSFNFGTNQGGITSIVRPVSNRGLGPGYTLVLVNGKRRHNGSQLTNGGGDTSGSNPVDLDMLPISAIAYVEVLKDSAAAQYGSDAVAGVINIVLKKGASGGHVAVTGGRLYEGKGDLDFEKGEADVGFRLGPGGFLHLSADARRRGQTWNNFFATNPPFSPATNPLNASWNGDGAHNGDPKILAFNLAYNLEVPLGEARLYSFGTFGGRKTTIGNNFRRPNGTAADPLLFPNGYYPLNNTAEYDLQDVVGIRGLIGGTSVDFSSSYGKNRVRQYSDFTINPSLGASSPEAFKHLATYQFEQWVQNLDVTKGVEVGLPRPLQVSAGVENRTDIFSTFAGEPLSYANGGYIFQPGDQDGDPNLGKPAAVGAQAGVNLAPADATRLSRSVLAGYLDLGVYPLASWYNGLAVRGEQYDDSSGTTVGGKINSRIDVLPQVAFRGTVGTGFRAPSLTQIAYAQTDSRTNINPVTGAIVPSKTVLARNASPLARALGAQDLKPEKSVNVGIGTVLRPFDRLSVTVDAYQVSIKDRIGRTGTLAGQGIGDVLVANGYAATDFTYYFANQADTRTRGLDAVAEWSHGFGAAGYLSLSAAFNANKTVITKVADTPAALAALAAAAAAAGDTTSSLVFFGRAPAGDLTVNIPYTKLILGAGWRVGTVSLSVLTTRYGSYDYVRSQIQAQDTSYGAKWLTNVDATLAVTDALEISVGAVNVFNVYPDQNGPLDPATGSSGLRYGPAPFAPTGGLYYGRLAYNF